MQEARPEAGAVRIKWPDDVARNEAETFMWCILQDADFAPRKDRHLAWRLSASELQKRAQVATDVGHAARKRQK